MSPLPLSPRSAGGDAAGRGRLPARPHQIAEAPHRHSVTPPPTGHVGAVGPTRRSPEGAAAAACPRAGSRHRGEARRHIPDTAKPCYHRLRTGVPFMRITRNRADASPRPTGSTRPRSARLNLTEPRQTNLIAPSPPDQIGTTPKIRPKPKNPPKTDHRRSRSPASPARESDRDHPQLRQPHPLPRRKPPLPARHQLRHDPPGRHRLAVEQGQRLSRNPGQLGDGCQVRRQSRGTSPNRPAQSSPAQTWSTSCSRRTGWPAPAATAGSRPALPPARSQNPALRERPPPHVQPNALMWPVQPD